jgi:hypothetical protein
MLPMEDDIYHIVDASKAQHLIDIRYLKSFQANLTIFTVDNVLSLIVESKDNTNEDPTAAATYLEFYYYPLPTFSSNFVCLASYTSDTSDTSDRWLIFL